MKNHNFNNPQFIGVLLLFIFAVIFGIFRSRKFKEKGLITVCKILKQEGSGDGADLYLEIYFRKNSYTVIVNDICLNCVGNYRYCKILTDNKNDVILLDENVPECIIKSLAKYDSGWSSIPNDTCNVKLLPR